MHLNKTRLLFLIILIEGYVVLACELLAIRQLIPFVGSGTETISIVISAVLLPLAVGYHAGGQAFNRHYRRMKHRDREALSVRKLLLRNILTSLMILALGMSYIFMELFFGAMEATGIRNRLAQTALYSLLFLVGPVFMLGQTVPLISNYFSRRKLSEITGKMLFFSTSGSFLGSVFSTIVLMMTIGVHNTVIVTLGLLAALCLLLARKTLSYETLLCAVIFMLVIALNNSAAMRALGVVSNNAYNIVSLVPVPADEAVIFNVNRSASSKLAKDPDKNFSYWKYIQSVFIETMPGEGPPKDVLVIGAGGFTLGLDDTHNHYTYVDIDKALKEVAEKHFLPQPLSPNKQFIAASGRAFVHHDTRTYDLIILDLFTSVYSIPMEATTREFLMDVKKRLKDGGIVVSNVIMSPSFGDRFSVRYGNTFASIFPAHTRQVIGMFDPWMTPGNNQKSRANHTRNVLYIYHHTPRTDDRAVYTDDLNTYSVDRD